jgi:ribose transport system ATP-binding protein
VTGETTAPRAEKSSALAARNISKTFGGAKALDAVDFTVGFGEVHGLLGANGSGKSTLIKILSGYHEPDPGGSLRLFGQPASLPLPAAEAKRQGLAFVHQHLGLAPSLTVLENLRIGDFGSQTRWRINWRAEAAAAEASFARFGLDLDPAAEVSTLSAVQKALLAIVRAFEDVSRAQAERGGGLLVLDEPTPFLPRSGVDQLFGLVRGVVKAGASVVFVSHDIDEVREITDFSTILRDGRVTGTVPTRETDRQDLVDLIVGRKVKTYQIARRPVPETPADIRIQGLSGAAISDFSIDMRRGEIVGLAGLIGSGYSDPPYLIYGAVPASAGSISVGAETRALAGISPQSAQAIGLALLPADRLGAAGAGNLSVTDNITLPVLSRFMRWFGLDRSGMVTTAGRLGSIHDVRPNNPALPLEALSGGNQQKVLLAKWLQTAPALILLDEPTQGVDVGARQQIYEALDVASRAGAAILVASTDYEQLAQIASRVLVFARGRVVAELSGDEVTKEHIAEACYRSAEAPREAA